VVLIVGCFFLKGSVLSPYGLTVLTNYIVNDAYNRMRCPQYIVLIHYYGSYSCYITGGFKVIFKEQPRSQTRPWLFLLHVCS